MILALGLLLVSAASGQLPLQLMNAANPLVRMNRPVTMYEFAPGTRVWAQSVSTLNLGRVNVTSVSCFDARRSALYLHPLGSAREYSATILALGPEGCRALSIEAVIPADMPLGPAEALLVDQDGQRYGPVAVRIIPFDFQVLNENAAPFSTDSGAAPPAIANRVEAGVRSRIGLTTPAVPGTVVALRGTGLGKARLDQITVQIGDVTIRPRAANPVPSEPGLDDLEFVIPPAVPLSGCYVPVRVRIEEVESIVTSIPLMSAPGHCNHRFALSKRQLEILDSGGRIPIGALPHWQQASFTRENRATVAYLAGADTGPPRATCQVSANPLFGISSSFGFLVPSASGITEYIDAGDQLRLVGPQRVLVFVKQGIGGLYNQSSELSSGPRDLFPSGVWQLQSDGSDEMQPFRWDFRLPPAWEPENVDALAKLRSGDNPELRWNRALFEPTEEVTLSLFSTELKYSLTCSAPADAGSMRIDVTSFLKAFGDSPPKSFTGQLGMSVQRGRASPYVFPLHLVDGTAGVGLGNATVGSGRSLKVEVESQ